MFPQISGIKPNMPFYLQYKPLKSKLYLQNGLIENVSKQLFTKKDKVVDALTIVEIIK